MRLLVLGGTWFLGRTLVEMALGRGWLVTTFNRGHGGVDVPGAEPVRGDRMNVEDVVRLASYGPWDAVMDTSGHVPAIVGSSATALAESTSWYGYVSTVNVYQGWPNKPLTDDSAVRESRPDLDAGRPEETQGLAGADRYGTFKAGCELAVRQVFDEAHAMILRPGVLLGPYEYVGRLPWLLRRMERGGRVLAAGPARPIQPLDVRDLAGFVLDAAEHRLSGSMNATAPIGHSTYGELLDTCRRVSGERATVEWVDDDWLVGQGVRQWSELPLWRTTAGAWNVSSDRAWNAGLRYRPLAATVADTWDWLNREEPTAHGRQAEIGLDPTKEAEPLEAWDRRSAAP